MNQAQLGHAVPSGTAQLTQATVSGPVHLRGEVGCGGAKNSLLPMLAACLLTDDTVTLTNVPDIEDIHVMLALLRRLGAQVRWPAVDTLEICCADCARDTDEPVVAPAHLAGMMRASIMVLGALLGRRCPVLIPSPGGCVLGPRPIDQHLMALRRLGADMEIDQGFVHAHPHGRLRGTTLPFDLVTVTGAQNAVLAACLADGETHISNMPTEPEVLDFLRMLQSMGACIAGIGTRHLTVRGVHRLRGTHYTVMPDRMVCGTWLLAAMATGGAITVTGAPAQQHMRKPLEYMAAMGAALRWHDPHTVSCALKGRANAVGIIADIYPHFPTDLQPQMVALAATARGASQITDRVFNGRWAHVPELVKLGATIKVRGDRVHIEGVPLLKGARIIANDMRGAAALLLAGLGAEGETQIASVQYLHRGYARMPEQLQALGATVHWS